MMGGGGGPKFGGLGGGLGGDYNLPSDEDSDDEEMPELDDIESETAVINTYHFFFLENNEHFMKFNCLKFIIIQGKGKEKSEENLPNLEEVKPATTA